MPMGIIPFVLRRKAMLPRAAEMSHRTRNIVMRSSFVCKFAANSLKMTVCDSIP